MSLLPQCSCTAVSETWNVSCARSYTALAYCEGNHWNQDLQLFWLKKVNIALLSKAAYPLIGPAMKRILLFSNTDSWKKWTASFRALKQKYVEHG